MENGEEADKTGKNQLHRMSLGQRIDIVRLSAVHEKYCRFREAWKVKYGIKAPSRKTVAAINKKFNETGSVLDLKKSGRPKSSRAPDKVALVEEAIRRNPSKSLRALSLDLDINRATIHRIKKGSESRNEFIVAENKFLKEENGRLIKKLSLLESRDIASVKDVPQGNENDNHGGVEADNNIPPGDMVLREPSTSMEVNKVVTLSQGSSTVITFTPLTNQNVLHFPTDGCGTFRIIEVQTNKSDQVDVFQDETHAVVHTCSREHPLPDCATCTLLQSTSLS